MTDRGDRAAPSHAAKLAVTANLDSIWTAPDAYAEHVVRGIASHYEIPPQCVAVGNGSTELIAALCYWKSAPGARMIFSSPTFPLYPKLAALYKFVVDVVPQELSYAVDLPGMLATIVADTRILAVESPSYISGAALSASQLEPLRSLPHHTIAIIDNVYGEFQKADITPFIRLASKGGTAVICRSFSKAYAMLGLRVGYMIGPEVLISEIKKRLLPFSVNLMAQTAAIAAIADRPALERNIQLNEKAKAMAITCTKELGITVVDTESSTILLDLREQASAFEEFCAARGIKIRGQQECGLFGHVQTHLIDPQTVLGALNALRDFKKLVRI